MIAGGKRTFGDLDEEEDDVFGPKKVTVMASPFGQSECSYSFFFKFDLTLIVFPSQMKRYLDFMALRI